MPIDKNERERNRPTGSSTEGKEYKHSETTNENLHEEDDVEIPSRATKRTGRESRQDRESRKDREQHPER